ncbi:MAG: N-acetylmuramoyl-L-alanine amidase [Bacteroidetes bacterium]|nr:N-acetylmuramoyl-L-alanine amidase [Bacteroidota bacterium]
MKIKYFFLLLLFFANFLSAQRLLKMSVSVDGKTERVSYLSRRGTEYVSAKELAQVLSGNYYYNEDAAKLELKFDNYKIKFTGRNQFVIVINRTDNSYQIYQIPVSTLLVKGDVLIPINYCIDYINLAYGKELVYNSMERHITATKKIYDTASFLKIDPAAVKPPEAPVKKTDSKFDIYGINIDEKSNGTLIRINTSRVITRYSSSIQNGVLFLFLPEISIDPAIFKNFKTAGLVKRIESKKTKGSLQLEFILNEGFSNSEAFLDNDNKDILITVHNKLLERTEPDLTDSKNKWGFDVIVIDAGHGGKDAGAIGTKGVREKDVNLGIALKLGKYIENNMKDVKVVYTRDDDTFVELYKRGKIANENNGKLFISIHANSLKKKPSTVKGFEVYLLRPGKTQKAIEIAEFENSVIEYEDNPDKYQKLTDENFILVSMAHSAYMRYSEKFSDILNQKWTRHTKIPSRGIKQAGFYVLVGASMPGVLIETGFLSNLEDEAYLKSTKGQQEIAEAIFNSIKEYKNYYDKTYEND